MKKLLKQLFVVMVFGLMLNPLISCFDDLLITGTVLLDGTGLEDVTLTLRRGSTTIDSTMTNSDGEYVFAEIEAGTYIITPSKEGYAFSPDNIEVTVDDEAILDQDFEAVIMITWAESYGGGDEDYAESIQQTSDGGYIVAGSTYSFGAGGSDFIVLKLDPNGVVEWQNTYGGSSDDAAESIQQTSDGGYIVAGYTESFGAGGQDFWVIKLDSNGTMDWSQTFGDAGDDYAKSVQQTTDGGYIVAGAKYDIVATFYDMWVIKLNSDGSLDWDNTYGGSSGDWAHSIQQTSDGGYIVAGNTFSYGAGSSDFYIVKLDVSGVQLWDQIYGGISAEYAESIQQTFDNGYIVTGRTNSFTAVSFDYWVIKLDDMGNDEWARIYGGSYYDLAFSVEQTSEGGYIVAGTSNTYPTSEEADYDYWILKLESDGDEEWSRTYGIVPGSSNEYARSIEQTSDGGYIVGGWSYTINSDIWILKLDRNGEY
ncbi:MAG: carboxypeptidase-like regulatory domain-containing protein [Spirochaetota bacterium]|nr:carboxypeptidase-like regulatory domain-containing protein [Spirochaetota bacterium]